MLKTAPGFFQFAFVTLSSVILLCVVLPAHAVSSLARVPLNTDYITLLIEDDANGDGFINREELHGPIEVSVILGGSVFAGHILTLEGDDETASVAIDGNHLLAQQVTFNFDPPVDSQSLTFSASLSDLEGALLADVSASVNVDLSPTDPPVVTIVADIDDSSFLSAGEYAENIDVRVELPFNAAVGDRVYVDYGRGNESVILTPLQIAEGVVNFSVPVAEEGETLSIVSTVVDEANNRSEPGTDLVTIDTLAPPVATVNPVTTKSATPGLSGSYPQGGDYMLVIALNGNTYNSTDDTLVVTDDGQWSLSVPASQALIDGVYDVSVTMTDRAGNASVDQTVDELVVDLLAPEVTVNAIAPSADAAPMISGATDQTDTGFVLIQNEPGVPLCLATTPGGQWSCSVRRQLEAGTNRLTATTSDAAGNVAVQPFEVSIVIASDSDNDGIADEFEGNVDTDGDSVADFLDLDSDNDGITDNIEGLVDSDGDNIRDYIDIDSDNDGIEDRIESAGSLFTIADSVGVNGIADHLEQAADNGVVIAPLDSDGDGIADFRDLDSDNDGVSDFAEYTAASNSDSLAWVDFDSDGLLNYIDLDSDQDGIADILEQRLDDADSNGIVDDFLDRNIDGLHDGLQSQSNASAADQDDDGMANFIDLDSDNDGYPDIVEAGGVDIDDDGRHDSDPDTNRNSVTDTVDVLLTGGEDINGNGIDDRYDSLLINDPDMDGDGVIDSMDPDADGNGIVDAASLDSSRLTSVYEYQPTAGALIATGTGTLGTGCVLLNSEGKTSAGRIDPTLWFLALMALVALLRRHIDIKNL